MHGCSNLCKTQWLVVITGFRTFSLNATARKSDLYAVLGIQRNASQKDIKAAYYELSKKHHPDTRVGGTRRSDKMFQEITEAYEILGNDVKRSIYDREVGSFGRVQREHEQWTSHRWQDFPYRDAYPREMDQFHKWDAKDYQAFLHFQRQRKARQRRGTTSFRPPEFWSNNLDPRHTESFYVHPKATSRYEMPGYKAEGFSGKLEISEEQYATRAYDIRAPTREELLRREYEARGTEAFRHLGAAFFLFGGITLISLAFGVGKDPAMMKKPVREANNP